MGILKQMPIPYIERQHMDIKINTAKKKRRKYRFVSVVSILVFLGIWYIATAVLELVPAYSLPSPVKVFSTLITKLYTQAPDGATLPQHFLASLQVATYGYVLGAVIGVPLGIAMGWFKTVDRIVRPVFDLLKPIPPIALIPVMIVVFGSSWMALVAAELLASTSGLGYLISVGRSLLRSDLIIVGILCLGMIGMVISVVFDLVEKRFVRGGKEQ